MRAVFGWRLKKKKKWRARVEPKTLDLRARERRGVVLVVLRLDEISEILNVLSILV